MSITFAIEAHTVAELDALACEHAPTLNVHNTGGYTLLAALGIEPDYCGSIDAAELLERIDRGPQRADPARTPAPSTSPNGCHGSARSPSPPHRLGRQVMWA